jgi:hypothetical protein
MNMTQFSQQLNFAHLNQSNNGAPWWPDIPVAIAILVTTVIMGMVCWDVHKTVQASKRWQPGSSGPTSSLSTQVFWQSFWYLM